MKKFGCDPWFMDQCFCKRTCGKGSRPMKHGQLRDVIMFTTGPYAGIDQGKFLANYPIQLGVYEKLGPE
jgi:hypothetical protein